MRLYNVTAFVYAKYMLTHVHVITYNDMNKGLKR